MAKKKERFNAMKERVEQLERKMREVVIRLERDQGEDNAAAAAMRNSIAELEARCSNGVFQYRITGYAEHLENAQQERILELYTPWFYTVCGYKLRLRWSILFM